MNNRPENGKTTEQSDAQNGPSQEELEEIRELYAQADAIVSAGDAVPADASEGTASDEVKGQKAGRDAAEGEGEQPPHPAAHPRSQDSDQSNSL